MTNFRPDPISLRQIQPMTETQPELETVRELPGLNWGAALLYWVWGPMNGHQRSLWVFAGHLLLTLCALMFVQYMFAYNSPLESLGLSLGVIVGPYVPILSWFSIKTYAIAHHDPLTTFIWYSPIFVTIPIRIYYLLNGNQIALQARPNDSVATIQQRQRRCFRLALIAKLGLSSLILLPFALLTLIGPFFLMGILALPEIIGSAALHTLIFPL